MQLTFAEILNTEEHLDELLFAVKILEVVIEGLISIGNVNNNASVMLNSASAENMIS